MDEPAACRACQQGGAGTLALVYSLAWLYLRQDESARPEPPASAGKKGAKRSPKAKPAKKTARKTAKRSPKAKSVKKAKK